MSHRVAIANLGREVLVPDNANLREVCLRERIPLYFGLGPWLNCRGRARCGRCEVRVVDGADSLSRPTPFEIAHYGGPPPPAKRLACQAQVRGPLAVDTRG